MRYNPIFFENLQISLGSIRSNLLRSILTIFIIAFGIMALVGILTALDAVKASLSNSLTMMGANTFAIESRGTDVHIGDEHRRTKNYSYISYNQAERFKNEFTFRFSKRLTGGYRKIRHRKNRSEYSDNGGGRELSSHRGL